MGTLKCPICHQHGWKHQFDIQDIFDEQYGFGSCLECKVYSLNPLPTERQLAQGYDESYYGEGKEKFNPLIEQVIDWFRSKKALKFSKSIPHKAVVLDIGCGNGRFLNSLSSYGEYALHGIEPEGKSGDRAALIQHINLHRGVLEEFTFPENTFDAIILTHVFEHLPNPLESLDIIDKIAKPGALLQIEIPNIDSWQFGYFKSNWFHLDPPRHLNMFPVKVLKNELFKRGWKLNTEVYISVQFSPYGMQQSLLNVFLNKRDALYEHLKGNKNSNVGYLKWSLIVQKWFHRLSFPIFIITDIFASFFKKGATVKLSFTKTNN